MRTDGEIAHARIVGQGHGDGRGCPALGAVQIDEVAHGGEVHGILGDGGGDGRLEGCSAVGIEQFGEASPRCTPRTAASCRSGTALGAA